jgi:hypothetical protein
MRFPNDGRRDLINCACVISRNEAQSRRYLGAAEFRAPVDCFSFGSFPSPAFPPWKANLPCALPDAQIQTGHHVCA